MNAEVQRALDAIERGVERIENAPAVALRQALGGAGGGEMKPQYKFPPIPTRGTQIVFMAAVDFTSNPFDPGAIGMNGALWVPHPSVQDGPWYARAGDTHWEPWGGKLSFHRGTPGTVYIREI